jgi:predicted RNase H-like HicB family nuclease
MSERFLVVYEWSGRNFGGFAPDIPGCAATGATLDEIRANLRSAIEAHLQWMAREHDSLPHPSTRKYVPDPESSEDLDIPGYYYVVELLDVTMPTSHKELATA